jgi:hypothetical protein
MLVLLLYDAPVVNRCTIVVAGIVAWRGTEQRDARVASSPLASPQRQTHMLAYLFSGSMANGGLNSIALVNALDSFDSSSLALQCA